MKFYRSATESIGCDINGFPDYGYTINMDIFTGTELEEFAKNSDFVIFTDGDLFKEKIIKKHDRILKTLERFLSSQTPEEQWRYYKRFLLSEPSYEFNRRAATKFLVEFDETGTVQINFQNGAMITTNKTGSKILSIIKMTRSEYSEFVKSLEEAGQIKKEIS